MGQEESQSKSQQRISSRHELMLDENRAQLASGAQTLRLVRRPLAGKLDRYWLAAGVVCLCTVLALVLPFADHSNVIMIYLMGVVFCATRLGRGPSVLSAFFSLMSFDWFFIPPLYRVGAWEGQYLLTLPMMLAVALIVSELSSRVRDRMVKLQKSEQFTAALYSMSRDLASARQVEEIKQVTARHIHEIFDCIALVLLPQGGKLEPRSGTQHLPPTELVPAQKSFEECRITTGSGERRGYYIPLSTSHTALGVLAILPRKSGVQLSGEQVDLLVAFANQAAVALERAYLSRTAQEAELIAERERVRSTLLSSVSHDLRTPLASITGAASSLIASSHELDQQSKELCQSIVQESERMNRLVANLLDMTKLESGAIRLRKDWQDIEEMIGAALSRLEKPLSAYKVNIHLPEGLPLIAVDEVLIEQVLINLLDNAVKYTPPGTTIDVTAQNHDREMIVEIANDGPPLPAGDENKVFEKFYRGKGDTQAYGAGLGLAICRGFIEAHGGRIWASNRDGGGVSFCFALPVQQAPVIEMDAIQV